MMDVGVPVARWPRAVAHSMWSGGVTLSTAPPAPHQLEQLGRGDLTVRPTPSHQRPQNSAMVPTR